MDNHPIPQDVTNFQFRFVGNMTIKQFGYIAAAVIIAWVFLAAPLPFLLRILFAGVCILVGVILSFVPIEGRPADAMIMQFINALLSPTQFIYRKASNALPATIPRPTQTITTPPVAEPRKKEKEDEVVNIQTLSSVAVPAAQQQAASAVTPPALSVPQSKPTQPLSNQNDQDLTKEVKILSKELSEAKAEEAQEKTGTQQASITHEKVVDLEKELQEVLSQKQNLEKQLLQLQKTLSEKKQQVFAPTIAQPQETQTVKKVPKQMERSVGAPLAPDVPNLISGVIKDPRGNVLPNMLIEVKDKDDNPVRAFKTNQLGQFASATPLTNGVYTISFEDPTDKQKFESIELQIIGDIVMPLEITSVDEREKLRQELFGN